MRKFVNILGIVVVVMFSTTLVSCGPSAEKIASVNYELYQLHYLVNETTVLVEAALSRNLMTAQGGAEYNVLLDAVNELLRMDLSTAANDEELDSVLESINSMKLEVSNLKATLERSLRR